jgi:hypothetical protein
MNNFSFGMCEAFELTSDELEGVSGGMRPRPVPYVNPNGQGGGGDGTTNAVVAALGVGLGAVLIAALG